VGLFTSRLPNLTIPSGQNVSNILRSNVAFEDAVFIVIYSPVAMDALTFTLQVTDNADNPVVIFNTFQLGDTPTDANLPAAGKARAYLELQGCDAIRIMSSAPVASDHVWRVTKHFRVK
jgi:hypothetical protein